MPLEEPIPTDEVAKHVIWPTSAALANTVEEEASASLLRRGAEQLLRRATFCQRKLMNRLIGLTASVMGFTGVLLGAFGAHGLKRLVEGLSDEAERVRWWETASRYHLVHALALGLVAVAAQHVSTKLPQVAAALLLGGTVLFSGSLYVMGVTGMRGLGAITPLGGLLQLGGWGALFLALWSLPASK